MENGDVKAAMQAVFEELMAMPEEAFIQKIIDVMFRRRLMLGASTSPDYSTILILPTSRTPSNLDDRQ
ncbi:MAG: hypothetical protein L3V56_10355 [Candidatus Magnetoovum sp. WYHC-5]|nr:hypothetical protein [Candidatus Magnetoovum sp. WYHC-5]